jgi:hypothetical protein
MSQARREKHISVPHFPVQISPGLPGVKPGSPRLEACAMARAILCGYYIYRLF